MFGAIEPSWVKRRRGRDRPCPANLPETPSIATQERFPRKVGESERDTDQLSTLAPNSDMRRSFMPMDGALGHHAPPWKQAPRCMSLLAHTLRAVLRSSGYLSFIWKNW